MEATKLPEGRPDEGEDKVVPTDHRRMVYYGVCYIGMTFLFPYIMCITIMDFWNYKFRDTSLLPNSTGEQITDLQKKFPGYLSISGNLPLAVFCILTTIFGWRFDLKKRILLTACGEVLAFGVIAIAAGIDTDHQQESLFILIMVGSTAYTSINAVLQASFLGNIGRFPPRYIGTTFDGTGIGQVLPAVVSIIVLATSLPKQIIGTACLSFALFTIVVMIVVYVFLTKSAFYRYHSGLDEKSSNGLTFKDFFTVIRSIWLYVFIVFMDYGITLSCHPALTALIRPVSTEPSQWNEKYFVPVCCFLVQSVSDWVGKFIATRTQWPKPGKWTDVGVAVAVVSRIAFIPAMLACNLAPGNRKTKIWFHTDIAWICFLTIFSITGGFLGNVGLMVGPKGRRH